MMDFRNKPLNIFVRYIARHKGLDGDRLTEKGTHEQLLAKNGEYAALCRAQELN